MLFSRSGNVDFRSFNSCFCLFFCTFEFLFVVIVLIANERARLFNSSNILSMFQGFFIWPCIWLIVVSMLSILDTCDLTVFSSFIRTVAHSGQGLEVMNFK